MTRARPHGWHLLTLALLVSLIMPVAAAAVTLNVLGVDRGAAGTTESPVAGYRWVLEEDATYEPQAGVADPNTLAVRFHQSYMAVVDQGDETKALPPLCPAAWPCRDPNKRYYVSVLPKTEGTYSIGGAPVPRGYDGAVNVYVNRLPLPFAQITVFVFHDNAPINSAPDVPEEQGLAGFSVYLEDGGGRYGMSAGMMMTNALGHMLGTEYQEDPATGQLVLDASGNPIVTRMGNGYLTTDAEGHATIKFLAPGKYGVIVVPPAGQGWQQTSTIEGTKVNDAWVKAGEPPYFQEFGPPGYHAFFGFIRPMSDASVLTGGATVSGQVVNLHLSRPPDYAFHKGAPFAHTTPWVGLNLAGRAVYAQRTNGDGTFSIPNVPPGDYQLVVWDDNLDLIFAFHALRVNPDLSCNALASCALPDIPVFQWFTRLEHYVFLDDGGGDPSKANNGFRDPGEMGIPEQAINLRWRDGTMYQSMPTDGEGFVPFDQVFPFFAWQVAEVDYLRFKATGVTVTVDGGGAIPMTEPRSFEGQLNPQVQADGRLYRTETGPVLTQAFQGFIGQTSVLEWGKDFYAPGENGGISGIVHYSTTRAEDDPLLGVAEVWEPGIPRVQVNLYRDCNGDGVIDMPDRTPGAAGCLAFGTAAGVMLADVDNHPLGWRDGGPKGPEDLDRNGDGVFDLGDALATAWTDSWDDNVPAGCPGPPFVFRGAPKDCYDGLRAFNQVRPGVFDGGYAFMDIPAGIYIVEAVPPRGYEIVKEEDKNVDFGDNHVPLAGGGMAAPAEAMAGGGVSTAALPLAFPLCVGDPRTVPAELSLFPGIPAAYGGATRPLCDRKQVLLRDGQNAGANFFFFTHVPVAGHIYGFILDDAANEFDPNAPNFGEKYAPPFLPVSIRDWTGREIARTLSDEYGVYNALVPSTYTANLPQPSGMSPNMLTVCLNSPVMPDPTEPGMYIEDPNFDSRYSQFCYTFQYMPGTTTYLDTPVVPVSAFTGPGQFPVDCEFPSGTPVIRRVTNPFNQGPYVPASGNRNLILASARQVEVDNPAYDGVGGTQPKTIARDFGFGARGINSRVFIGDVRVPDASITRWTNDLIIVNLPAAFTTSGPVTVRRHDTGRTSPLGAYVTVGGPTPILVRPAAVAPGQPGPIQRAVDLAAPDSLILVAPGQYDEQVILWKPVRLQGWGAGSTFINAVKVPAEKTQYWRGKVQNLIDSGVIDLLPGQAPAVNTFAEAEGAGVLVLAKDSGPNRFGLVGARPNARIDGFTITGADHAGGVVVNGYAHYLEISNNRIANNSGVWGGGIRLGHATLVSETPDGPQLQPAFNDHVRIRLNQIVQNGGLNGAGGGVSVCTGSDAYEITENWICGNFTMGQGGGIGHLGLSPGGRIARNTIIFNESFNQGVTVSGGGVYIGSAPLAAGGLTGGTGSVSLVANLIQGNAAGAGDGGGIRLERVNGTDVQANPGQPESWHAVEVLNNIIVNNVAGLAGGAISLQDAAAVRILHNTIANNDSTATAGAAFTPGSPNQSTPQPAGIVSRAHSPELTVAFAGAADRFAVFSDPDLRNNIIWHNRSFYFAGDPNGTPPVYGLLADLTQPTATPVYADLAVLGTATPVQLQPQYSVLTSTTGAGATNTSADPRLLLEYVNGDRGQTILQPEITAGIQAPPAFDEGGNFIRLRFGPLTLMRIDPATGQPTGQAYGDYHIGGTSPARGRGLNLNGLSIDLTSDYDGQARPNPVGSSPDAGADERP